MTDFPIRILRSASYMEVVDAVIVAKSKEEAEAIADALGNGKEFSHPTLKRYNIWERDPLSYETVEVAHVKPT